MSTLYAWTDTSENTIYTQSSSPSQGDTIYNESGEATESTIASVTTETDTVTAIVVSDTTYNRDQTADISDNESSDTDDDTDTDTDTDTDDDNEGESGNGGSSGSNTVNIGDNTMARDNITVHLPVADTTKSVETVKITKQAVTQANGIKISNALDNKNNSLQIFVENTTGADSTPADSSLTIKAGNEYPNKILGDLTITLSKSAITVVLLEDISRFENRDGSIYLDFASGFTGNIWAVAKRAGLQPVT